MYLYGVVPYESYDVPVDLKEVVMYDLSLKSWCN